MPRASAADAAETAHRILDVATAHFAEHGYAAASVDELARAAGVTRGAVYHHYTSTHPKSPFTGRLVIMTIEPGVARRLLGRELTVEKPDGTSETSTVAPDELDATLKDLGIELTADELDRMKNVY